MSADRLAAIFSYHQRTKHHFQRYARSLGYLDWANQPHPFRYYAGAAHLALDPHQSPPAIPYEAMYAGGIAARPVDSESLGDFLRHSMALTAWKQAGASRWALRANPSSGNLHPTEAYLAVESLPGFASPGLFHYVSETHTLERRADFTPILWRQVLVGQPEGAFLIGLSSIVWREAWKYGERAFRYCQHDTGHALAALSLSAALCGWKLRLATGWSTTEMAAWMGLDRAGDFLPEELEEPELLALVTPMGTADVPLARPEETALGGLARLPWHGKPNPLSAEHTAWPILEIAAQSTRIPASADWGEMPGEPVSKSHRLLPALFETVEAHRVILNRRSAVDFDGVSRLSRESFFRMLARTLPADHAPWDALAWPPAVDLVLFVHRVDDVEPGLYLLARDPARVSRWKTTMRAEFAWSMPAGTPDGLPLWLLRAGDFRDIARNLSCHQEIASDGFFSLGMLADFAGPITARGAWFYRPLFWEAGVIGQVLYLEAEAHGVRATGIGCYFDDPVHDLLGLSGNAAQSLYHFTVGMPVDDARLQTSPAYASAR